MTQIVEIFLRVKKTIHLVYIVNNTSADILTKQGARASATMILTMLDRINAVLACLGFWHY